MLLFRPGIEMFATQKMRDWYTEVAMDRLGIHSRQAIIPRDEALRLCEELRRENAGHWYSPRAWRCARCIARGYDGVPARLVTDHPGYCGCQNVIQRYRTEHSG
jgi:hypothetical protein